jgi:hypothetical protein
MLKIFSMSVLVQYSYLQVLDLLTTLAFLANGVREGNPLVALAMETQNPLIGLVLVKFAAVLLGMYCWRKGRMETLARANVWFALLIAWNLVAIIVSSSGRT